MIFVQNFKKAENRANLTQNRKRKEIINIIKAQIYKIKNLIIQILSKLTITH